MEGGGWDYEEYVISKANNCSKPIEEMNDWVQEKWF